MKATAKSPANIAFIKYWGKLNPETRRPQNNSISMCLSDLFTLCTVEFDSKYKEDQIHSWGEEIREEEIVRVRDVLARIRELAKREFYDKSCIHAHDLYKNKKAKFVDWGVKVVTKNNFPKGVGLASSASVFSAITLAFCVALGWRLSQQELSKLARLFSGSACRSIPDGFVEWVKGEDEGTSYARQIFPPDWWDLRDIVAIVSHKMKKVKSTQGHALAKTSPFYQTRITMIERKVEKVKKAIKERDFSQFGQILEQEALELHAICLTSQPALLYWEGTTIEIMKKVQQWREDRLEAYFTLDAGPSVHIICQAKDEKKVVEGLRGLRGLERISVNKPGIGARVISKHLF